MDYFDGLCIMQIGGTYAKPVLLPTELVIGALGKIQVIILSACFFLAIHVPVVVMSIEPRCQLNVRYNRDITLYLLQWQISGV